MSSSKTQQRWRPWVRFAMVAAVVVGLSLGIFQLIPESHPMRALQGMTAGTDKVIEPVTVQGVPLTTTGGTVDIPQSGDGTGAQPTPTAAAPVPKRRGGQNADQKDGYQLLTFDTLISYPIKEPNWAKMTDPVYISSLNLDAQIAPALQAMNGKKVEIQGFMLPLDMSDGNLQTFMLLKDQMACCFGNIPRLNEWVYVRVPKKKQINVHQDVLVTLFGTLHVGAKFEQEILTGIYHLDLDRIQVSTLRLDRL